MPDRLFHSWRRSPLMLREASLFLIDCSKTQNNRDQTMTLRNEGTFAELEGYVTAIVLRA